VVTAQPDGRTPKLADVVFTIPAQTMANDQGGPVSVLPMGSLFETAQMLRPELNGSLSEPAQPSAEAEQPGHQA